MLHKEFQKWNLEKKRCSELMTKDVASGFMSEDEYLEITSITREQSGEYECSASNDVATPVVRRVKVTVNYPPYISDTKNTGVPVGQKGILQCEASAVPSAEFQWYKDDKRANYEAIYLFSLLSSFFSLPIVSLPGLEISEPTSSTLFQGQYCLAVCHICSASPYCNSPPLPLIHIA
ncbi:putative Protein CEPU-1 protein [Naja naja]|nr:putative Protein CEPU-1 protein [Naja naja]